MLSAELQFQKNCSRAERGWKGKVPLKLGANRFIINVLIEISDLFRLCPPPPKLGGCIILATPRRARTIFLHNDLLCNDMLFNWGEHKRKRSEIVISEELFLLALFSILR